MIYFSKGRKAIVLTLVSMFLLGGMQGVCYSQNVTGTVNEVMSAAELREKVLPTVVYIKSKKGFGSGVVIKTSEDNTFVLTNEHVTRGSDEVKVFFLAYDAKQNEIRDSEFYFGSQHAATLLRRLGYAIEGRVVAEDKAADVAVIDLYSFPKTIESILLKNVDLYDHLKVGDIVHFLGHPGDQELLWQWNLGQFRGYDDRGMLLEARPYKGNSGGPVLNKEGELIGIMKSTDDVTKAWAAPLEPIIDLVKDLKEWDIISIVNETESDVAYEVNWLEGETWERNTLEPGQWKIHKQPTNAYGTFHPKIRYVSIVKQTPQALADTTDTKDIEEQNDENGENIVENEHKLRYIIRRFFSSDDTDRIKPKLDGANYRFVSTDTKNIEFQEMRQTVWIANYTLKEQEYIIKWSPDRFDEGIYTLQPGKAKPHWSTRNFVGLSANYPKIRYKYTIFYSANHTYRGTIEKSITITKEPQFYPIDAKPDNYIKDLKEIKNDIKDNIQGYYHLHQSKKNEVPEIHDGLPTLEEGKNKTANEGLTTPEKDENKTANEGLTTPEKKQSNEGLTTPEKKQTETSKKWEKLIIPICLGITVISLSVVTVFAIQYFYPRRHIFSIKNNTDSTIDFHIWTKKTNWRPGSLEPGKSQIYLYPGFFKQKPVIHFAQIVNYEKRTTRLTLETRSQRYRRSAETQNYQEVARKYNFAYTETDEIGLFDSEG